MEHIASIRDLHTKFSAMLAEDLSEQHYQSFMEANPRLIPREFIQTTDYTSILSCGNSRLLRTTSRTFST